jgi:hypothetical protein
MLNPTYKKALYQLASAQKKETGIYRSFVQTPIAQGLNTALYNIIKEAEGISLTDPEILPYLIGNETELLTQKCLNTFWAWLILREACFKSGETPIEEAIAQRCSFTKESYPELTKAPIAQMEPKQIAQFTAYGFLLWDGAKNAIAPNPIFF